MLRILLSESDRATGEVLTRLIRRLWHGASILVEPDPLSAIERCEREGADLLLLDWSFPGGDGCEHLKEIRRVADTTPCVLLSNCTKRECILTARACQAADYLSKPFEVNNLAAHLSRVMALSRKTPSQPLDQPSIYGFVRSQLTQGTLDVPIDAALIGRIKEIPQLDPQTRVQLLAECQRHPAVALHLLGLANQQRPVPTFRPIDTFEEAIRQVGLDAFITLAIEMSYDPESELRQDVLLARYLGFQREWQSLTEILSRLSLELRFDVAAALTAALFFRLGELSLLRLMQGWIDMGHSLSESVCNCVLQTHSARAGYRIKTQWRIPQGIQERVGAIYFLPAGTKRLDLFVMRIAGLLLQGNDDRELSHLMDRVGLDGKQPSAYRAASPRTRVMLAV